MKRLGLLQRAEIIKLTKDEHLALNMNKFLTEKAQQGLLKVKDCQIICLNDIKLEVYHEQR